MAPQAIGFPLSSRDSSKELIQPLPALQQRAEHAFPQIEPPMPDRALLCFGHPFLAEAKRLCGAESTGNYAGEQEVYRGVWDGTPVILAATGVGSPASAMVAEKLIAGGCEMLVGVGFCGGLRVGSGACIVPTSIHGQPGITHAYGQPEPEPDGGMVVALNAAAHRQDLAINEGAHWTTDAIYRETDARVNRYRKKGCLGVDMESAGLLVAADHRGAKAGVLLVVTDTLDSKWRPVDRLPEGLVDDVVRAGLAALTS